MTSAADILRSAGITTKPTEPGRYYATCPQCSRSRQKRHQHLPCLGVTIDSNGVGWKCFHCGWRGGAFYDGRRTRCRASGRTGVAPAVPRTALKKTASQDEAQRTSHALRNSVNLGSNPSPPAIKKHRYFLRAGGISDSKTKRTIRNGKRTTDAQESAQRKTQFQRPPDPESRSPGAAETATGAKQVANQSHSKNIEPTAPVQVAERTAGVSCGGVR
jgi:hypothetical protein